MRSLEAGELRGAGGIDDVFLMVEVFEDFLRCAERLLEDVVDADQTLERLEQHEQRDEKLVKCPAVKVPALICMRA